MLKPQVPGERSPTAGDGPLSNQTLYPFLLGLRERDHIGINFEFPAHRGHGPGSGSTLACLSTSWNSVSPLQKKGALLEEFRIPSGLKMRSWGKTEFKSYRFHSIGNSTFHEDGGYDGDFQGAPKPQGLAEKWFPPQPGQGSGSPGLSAMECQP